MSFAQVAPQLMSRLMADYGLTREQAAGFVGNLAHESGGFNTLQEVKPLVEGSRGGYGYAQWTGPRRRQFEAWSNANGLDPSSFDANYGFLRYELDNTPEGNVLGKLRAAPDVATATKVVEQGFLRPGIPHTESRMKWASRVLGGGDTAPVSSAPVSQKVNKATNSAPAISDRPRAAAPTVAALTGAERTNPLGLLAMLGEVPTTEQAPPPDPRQAFAANYAWARQIGWRG